jgi:hypothetical protein
MEYKINAELENYDFYESTLNKTYYRINSGYKRQNRVEEVGTEGKETKKKVSKKTQR